MNETMSTVRLDEEVLVHRWRSSQLERLGVSTWLADILANRVDWRDIAALMKRGCPLGLALDIVR